MQKRFFSTEFFIILLFFALPPIIFAGENPAGQTLHFSWTTFALAALAAALYWQMKIQQADGKAEKKGMRRLRGFLQQGQTLLTFGGLLVWAGLLELAARFILQKEEGVIIMPPRCLPDWITFFFGILCAAFYEEVLYRVYLPETACKIFAAQKNSPAHDESRQKKIAGICEAASIVLFALAHSHAGPLAVTNALGAGILLRRCYKKTSVLWTNLSAHLAYNLVMAAVSLA